MNDSSELIGYEEDGVFWVTASTSIPDAAAAERQMGPGWRVVAEVYLAPTGRMANSSDAEWAECDATMAGARPGWRLEIA